MPFLFDYTVHQQLTCGQLFLFLSFVQIYVLHLRYFALTHIVSSQQLQICISAPKRHYSPLNYVAELAYFATFEFCLW